jgi:hypothetical protein
MTKLDGKTANHSSIKGKTVRLSMIDCDEKPDIGAKAFIVGAPRGLDFSISDGIISQIDTIDGKKIIQYTCPTSPGNSGGPLLDSSGKVRGVVSFLLKDSQNLNFAVPISYVSGFDLSLPTVPWNDVTETLTSSSQGKKLDQGELDKLMMSVVRLNRLGSMVRTNFSELNKQNPYSLTFGPTTRVISLYRELLGLDEQLKGVITEGKSLILGDAQKIISKWVVAYENIIKFFELEQRRDRTSITYLRLADVIIDEVFSQAFAPNYKAYVFSDGFAAKRPVGLRLLGMKLFLGLDAFPDDPQTIVTIWDAGYAKKYADFTVGDRLISSEKGELKDLTDLEDLILVSTGSTIKVKIVRNKKEKDISIKIPKEIPKEYIPKRN